MVLWAFKPWIRLQPRSPILANSCWLAHKYVETPYQSIFLVILPPPAYPEPRHLLSHPYFLRIRDFRQVKPFAWWQRPARSGIGFDSRVACRKKDWGLASQPAMAGPIYGITTEAAEGP
jgi:hypothetical protein